MAGRVYNLKNFFVFFLLFSFAALLVLSAGYLLKDSIDSTKHRHIQEIVQNNKYQIDTITKLMEQKSDDLALFGSMLYENRGKLSKPELESKSIDYLKKVFCCFLTASVAGSGLSHTLL
jgi:hypothetical protein